MARPRSVKGNFICVGGTVDGSNSEMAFDSHETVYTLSIACQRHLLTMREVEGPIAVPVENICISCLNYVHGHSTHGHYRWTADSVSMRIPHSKTQNPHRNWRFDARSTHSLHPLLQNHRPYLQVITCPHPLPGPPRLS